MRSSLGVRVVNGHSTAVKTVWVLLGCFLWQTAGFPMSLVVPSPMLVQEFVCAICLGLVDNPCTTPCTHVFCQSCIEEWLAQEGRMQRCPNCQASLGEIRSVVPLANGNPLAHRILSRVQCRCPLTASGDNCSWIGDYSEVHAHLTSSTSHPNSDSVSPGVRASSLRARAEGLKAQGNERMEQRQFQAAEQLYSKALELTPESAPLLANRGAARLLLRRYASCIQDCQSAISQDPECVKAYVSMSRALGGQGRLQDALSVLLRAKGAVPTPAPDLERELDKVRQEEEGGKEARRLLEQGELDGAREVMEIVQEAHGSCLSPASELLLARIDLAQGFEVWRRRAGVARICSGDVIWVDERVRRTAQGLLSAALRISLEVMRRDHTNVEAVAVRGEALFLSGDCAQAVLHLKEALRLDPDHRNARTLFKRARLAGEALSAAEAAMKKRDFTAAIAALTNLLDGADPPHNAPLRARALAERGSAWLGLKEPAKAIDDSNAALAVQEELRSARLTRDKALIALGQLDAAIEGLEKTLEDGKDDEVVQYWLDKAKFEKRRLARPDYYKLLNISALCLEADVRSAYRTATLTCHPDRLAGKSEEEKAAAARQFSVVSDALEILTDPLKRQLYDEGHDKEAIAERVEAANRAAKGEGRRRHRD